MKENQICARIAHGIVAAILIVGAVPPVSAANAGNSATPAANTYFMDVMVTNRVAHFFTNLVEVRVPYNVFRDEFQTNWVENFRTNTVEVFKTNWLQRTLTNTIAVDLMRTNWVRSFRTNVYPLTLTNWESVVIIKTNWVTQSVTNVVDISLQAGSPSAPVAVRESAPGQALSKVQTIGHSRGLRIELCRTAMPPANNKVEVQFELKSDTDSAASLRVQEWQLARPDRTVLMLGQRLKFTTDLSPGSYKVLVKARADENAPWISVKGAMEVGEGGMVQGTPEVALNSTTP